MVPDRRARRAALNVSASVLLLAIAKGVIGFATGSVAVLASALDSAGDVLASFANYVFLTIAEKPPDDGHHFGHGKAEHLATMLQGFILLAGGVMLGLHAVERIITPRPVVASAVAIGTMIVSIAATLVITRYLKRNAAQTESTALAADSMHYTSDIVANGATIIALVFVRLTGSPRIDSILGISVACWVAWNSLMLIWNAVGDLMDRALPSNEIEAIIEPIERADPAVVGYRELRTRRAAGIRFIDVELCIDREVSFEHAHEITERVKELIRERFPRAIINAHAEPVEGQKTERSVGHPERSEGSQNTRSLF
jgi:ferrous-iron efflux pump FieF